MAQGSGLLPLGSQSPLDSAGEWGRGRSLGSGLEGHTLFSLTFHQHNSVMDPSHCGGAREIQPATLQEETDRLLVANSRLCHITRETCVTVQSVV